MASKACLILQLIISLCAHKVLSHCTTTDFCSLRNTRGASIYNSSMSKLYMSMTCQRACSLHPGCTATTYDSTRETCELHEAGTEGTPCMTLTNDEGSSLWIRKQPTRSCPKVSCEKEFNIAVNLQIRLIIWMISVVLCSRTVACK